MRDVLMGCFSSKAEGIETLPEPPSRPGRPNSLENFSLRDIAASVEASQEIEEGQVKLENISSKEVIVYVVKDPSALRLRKKNVGAGVDAGLAAGAYGVGIKAGGSKNSTVEYEANGGVGWTQKIRIKPKRFSIVTVTPPGTYVAVVFYKDNLYHYAVEGRELPPRGHFKIRDDHLESEIPFKTSAEEPIYGTMMESGDI